MTTVDHQPPQHDEHPPHLAHHFDTPVQQFESAVLGMWLFLATEILLFGGMFCAYAVYRANHPEIFYYAYHEKLLSVPLGAINTVILLISSFTMAAAVWAVQRSYQKMLCWMLGITIACGFGFMCIKYVEYKHKWEMGLGWGQYYDPSKYHTHGHGDEHTNDMDHGSATAGTTDTHENEHAAPATAESGNADAPGAATDSAAPDPNWVFTPADTGPRGLLMPDRGPLPKLSRDPEVRNVQTFFAIYFGMTGLHGIHVLAGMGAIGWVLWRSIRGDFNADYFTPVPMVGLYWHVVDLIWIYLFPLLYLIH